MWYRTANRQDPNESGTLEGFQPMTHQEMLDDEDRMYTWMEEYDDQAQGFMGEFLQNPKGRQSWPVVPFARLKKIWEDYAKYGIIRDTKGLDEIAATMITNTMKLYFNTVMCGHTPVGDQEDHIYRFLSDSQEWTDELDDAFGDHVEDDNGMWRLSDYALEPLMNDASELRFAQTPEEKLGIIDRMLNRVHRRSDIAALYLEGGSRSLDLLANG